MDVPALRRDLLAWFDAEARDLPWRREPHASDPYAIWVSEVMLQQTRVQTVVPYFERWMKRFPTIASLADATEDDVASAWSGLGYYRRAQNLHRAATLALDGVPDTVEGWQELPGVGDYTAAAIASIAQGAPAAAVDGNVLRVVARLACLDGDITKPDTRRSIEALAKQWLDAERPGDWNQAMMELGATHCGRSPDCDPCPVSSHCAALAAGRQDDLPVRAKKRPPKEEEVHFAMVMGDGRLLLVKRPAGLLGGTWALPGGGKDRPLETWVREQAGLEIQASQSSAQATHVFTHRRWTMHVRSGHVLDVLPAGPAWEVRWAPLNRLESVGLSTAMRKALAAAGLPVL